MQRSPGTPKIAACTVGSNAGCHNNETCVDLSGPPAPPPTLQIGKVCDTQSVAALGNFNIDVSCPAGDVVVSRGYSCSYNLGANLLNVLVQENTFFGYPAPTGWQTVGTSIDENAGSCTVCTTCTPGACKNPINCSP